MYDSIEHLEKSKQALFFQALQKNAQTILANNPKLLRTQAWATQRGGRISATGKPIFKANSRNIYWYIAVVFELSSAYDLDRELSFDIVYFLTLGDYLEYDMFKKNPEKAIAMILGLACSRALELARFHSEILTLDDTLANTPIVDIIQVIKKNQFFQVFQGRNPRDLDLDDALTRTINLENSINLAIFHHITYISKHTFEQSDPVLTFDQNMATIDFTNRSIEDLKNLLIDLNAINLVLFANIFANLPKEERSKKRVEILQTLLTKLQEVQLYLSDSSKVIICPSYQASDQEWRTFKNVINEMVAILLEIDLSTTWNKDDYSTTISYLQVNELITDCLRSTKVKNHEVFENTYLNAPGT